MNTPTERFYAAPSRTSSGSWSVFDRSAPRGRDVEVPHVTRAQAYAEARRLNAPNGERNVSTCTDSKPCGEPGCWWCED